MWVTIPFLFCLWLWQVRNSFYVFLLAPTLKLISVAFPCELQTVKQTCCCFCCSDVDLV